MTSIDYNIIFQSFYSRLEAFDFLQMDDFTVNEFLCNWIHDAVRPPYIRRLFKSVVFDDDIMRLSYEMNRSSGSDDEDKDFVVELLALGMGIGWLTPKVNSLLHLRQMYGSKEERFFSEAQHLTATKELLDSWKKDQRRMISDRGWIYNAYVQGEDLSL